MSFTELFDKISLNNIVNRIGRSLVGALFIVAVVVIAYMGNEMKDMYGSKQYDAIARDRDRAYELKNNCEIELKELNLLLYKKADSIAYLLFVQKMKYLNINEKSESTILITPQN